jgi:lipopolysaccharide transport system ATP-binding protein
MKPIIEVKGLSKRYKLGVFNAKTLREEAEAFLARFSRKKGERITEKAEGVGSSLSSLHSPSAQSADFWALRDVSFDVQPGEVIGVIGRNGAGKSTLLKILSRITEPTSGEARIRGRVASLLEVGTGFHPELTGRENIFLNGTILGMTKAEIRYKFDEIVEFSGVEKFIDTPVKRYSSGMYVRLAFAVAAHLEPEILIVDEVLAVGDAEFQRKCLGKMKDVSSQDGRTVLFVSHNMVAMQNLCNRCIWMDQGQIARAGATEDVVRAYLTEHQTFATRRAWPRGGEAPGPAEIKIRELEVVNPGGGEVVCASEQINVRVRYEQLNDTPRPLTLNTHLIDENGVLVLSGKGAAAFQQSGAGRRKGEYEFGYTIPAGILNSGAYNLKVIAFEDQQLKWQDDSLLVFDIVDQRDKERTSGNYARVSGVLNPALQQYVKAVSM